jgi:hypothetical protein
MEVRISMVKDPVCGMNVDEKTATLKSEYMGKTYTSVISRAKKYLKRTHKDSLTKILKMRKMIVVVADNKQSSRGCSAQ